MSKSRSAVQSELQHEIVEPSVARVVEAIRRIGHSPEDAIQDICDNSVQWQASQIDIYLSGGKTFDRIEVADNGASMDRGGVIEALRLGSPDNYGSNSLSKYGLGLKSAALSQGRRLTVLARCEGGTLHKAIVDVDEIKARNQYVVLIGEGSAEDWDAFEERTGGIGTVVIIDKIDAHSAKGLLATINRTKRLVAETYHRFMNAADPVTFRVNGAPLVAFDPLAIGDAQVEDLLVPQTLEFEDADGKTVTATVRARQLPHPPSSDNRNELKKKYDISQKNMGFYVYRENRIIRRAETFDLFTPETRLLAFRASIDFNSDADSLIDLDVAKHQVVLSDRVHGKLDEVFRPILHRSREIWKSATKQVEPSQPDSIHKKSSSQINAKDSLLSTGRKERATPQEKARNASDRIKRLVEPPKDKVRVEATEDITNGLLWEPCVDTDGKVHVRINKSHPFYDRVYRTYASEDPDLIEAVDYLLWALAHAEYNIGYDENDKIETMEAIRLFASSNLRRLLSE
jgi:hypothetical protein